MHHYTWKIESVDNSNSTMVVEYTHDAVATRLNIPTPAAGADLTTWVGTYAPVDQWKSMQTPGPIDIVAVGTEGTGSFEIVDPVDTEPASETPNVAGSVNEEYLRALIYQVLEEIKDAQV